VKTGPKPKPVTYVVNERGCHICTSHARSQSGYPVMRVDGKLRRLSRLAFGEIPDDLIVRHTCDNPACVNPAHLVLGTQADNMRDAAERGRMASGERHYRSRLTQAQVLEIRALAGHPRCKVATRFAVSPGTIRAIQDGRTWKHLLPKQEAR
jgi:hypothetical protein